MQYFSFFLLVFGLVFLAVLPHFLWIRWIIRAFRKRHAAGRVISVLSYLLFLIPFWVLLKGGNRYYGRSAAAEQIEVYMLLGMALLSIILPVGYFCGRWIYYAYRGKAKKSG